jgi:hypothetical protein
MSIKARLGGCEMARKNALLSDAIVIEEAIRCFCGGPILAGGRNRLPGRPRHARRNLMQTARKPPVGQFVAA